MKRRVIQIAESTQLISLPRKWALQHHIKKGDELEITENGASLSVTAGKKADKLRTELDITDLDVILPRILHALYKVGFDEVKLNYSKPDYLETIQKRLQHEMVGFEIIEQHHDYCVVRAFAEGIESEFDVVLRRIFRLLKSMAEGVLEAVEKKDTAMVKSMRVLEANNNKYTGYCRRIINKGNYMLAYSPLMYGIVEELEKIADEFKYMCDFFIDNPHQIQSVSKNTSQLFRDMNSLYEDAYEVFYKFSLEGCAALFTKRKSLIRKSRQAKIGKDVTQSDISMYHYFIVIIQKIANILSYRFEIALREKAKM